MQGLVRSVESGNALGKKVRTRLSKLRERERVGENTSLCGFRKLAPEIFYSREHWWQISTLANIGQALARVVVHTCKLFTTFNSACLSPSAFCPPFAVTV